MTLMASIKKHHDPHDVFGFTQEWRFALAEYLYWYKGEDTPGYRNVNDYQPEDSYTLAFIADADPNEEEVRYAQKILDRYREWIRIAEKDY